MPKTTTHFLKDATYTRTSLDCQAIYGFKDNDTTEPFGYLEGYLAVFNNIDEGRDMILPGAFTKTIKERVAAGKVPLMAEHAGRGGSAKDVVGIIAWAKEDKHGLFIHAPFGPTDLAQEMRKQTAAKMIKGLSIGFNVIDYEIVDPANPASLPALLGADTNFPSQEAYVILKELKLREGTITPFPMNEEATITKVKSRTTSETPSPEGTEKAGTSKATGSISPSVAYYESLVQLTKSAFLLERSR